ncbi:MAG: DUF1800 family protein [Pseudomonadota bacterium]
MPIVFRQSALLLSTTGALALSIGLLSSPAAAQQAGSASVGLAQIAEYRETFQAPFDGTYTFTIPAEAGATISIDGAELMRATETIEGQTLSAITSLQAGPREIVVTGLDPAAMSITVKPSGGMTARIGTSGVASATLAEPVMPTPSEARVASTSTESASRTIPLPPADIAQATLADTGSAAPAPAPTASEVRAPRVATGQARGGRSGSLAAILRSMPGGDDGTPAGGAPLAPPTGASVESGIALTYTGDDGRVPNTGATLFGAVGSDVFYDQIEVTVAPSGRQTIVDVGPQTGQFAFRLFPDDLDRSAVTVSLSGMVSSDPDMRSAPVQVELEPVPLSPGAMMAMGRLTFGPTPALHAKMRTMSFEDFVDEQLDPDSINDGVLNNIVGNLMTRDWRDNNGNAQGYRYRQAWQNYELARAVFSERQFQEVMGRFWFNHFHARTKDTSVRYQNVLDRDYFRENAFGNFGDLLLYSARSPLMSQYLDNDESRRGNINENYGREILELHTVGVDGGYTLEDITAVARIFTGWDWERTVDANDTDYKDRHAFQFRADRHDTDDKIIPFIDLTIEGRTGADGEQEGVELIAVLANLPQTQSFVCRKIVQLLAADNPPQNLVDACVAAWEQTGGEIEPALRAILLHPDYLGLAEIRRAKVKTPFEYVASVARAFGMRPTPENRDTFLAVLRNGHINGGEDQFNFAAPTGLPEVGGAWTNSASFMGLYRGMVDLTRDPNRFGWNPVDAIQDAGLETAEEVASYLLLGTNDHYSQPEFEAVVAELKGDDGIFDLHNRNEAQALRRGMIATIVQPSQHIQ